MINVDSIPEELREVPQWVCWKTKERDGKQTKIPVNPQTDVFASVRDSQTWASFDEAVETATANESVAGVGFVFTEDDPFVGVDLDDCRDAETGKPEPWARSLLEQIDSFSEVSPSGTGFHIYIRGELPDGGNRSGSIECYEAARFFTVTGKWVPGTPTEIYDRSDVLADVHAEHIAESDPTETETEMTPESSTTGPLDDEELLSRAMNAKNGPKFTRLWNGDTSGYDSHSEADMALCFLLAFWTKKSAAQIDRLFRRSGLFREKWDERHYSDGRTYGEGTVERAIRETTEVYVPGGSERRALMTERGESVTTSSSLGEESADQVNLAVLERISELETTVTNLTGELKALEAQHEYLYESLQTEQERHERTRRRLRKLESVVEEGQKSWFSRLF